MLRMYNLLRGVAVIKIKCACKNPLVRKPRRYEICLVYFNLILKLTMEEEMVSPGIDQTTQQQKFFIGQTGFNKQKSQEFE